MEKLKRPVILVDGDILAYRAASATDGRQYKVEWETPTGLHLVKILKYKKDADHILSELESHDIKATCTLEYRPEPLQNALKIVKDMMVSLETGLSEHVDGLGPRQIFITRGGSFREALVPDYKMLRAEGRRPVHLEDCKDYILKYLGGHCMVGEYEADDLLAIAATEFKGACVVCSVDKDLLQVPGHHYNFIKGEYKVIGEEEAHRNLYMQLLVGDTADGIPGIHGIGPVGAMKLLKDHTTPFMMYVECLRAYIRHTGKEEGESTEEYYLRCVQLVRTHMSLLYLVREKGVYWEVPRKDEDS